MATYSFNVRDLLQTVNRIVTFSYKWKLCHLPVHEFNLFCFEFPFIYEQRHVIFNNVTYGARYKIHFYCLSVEAGFYSDV